MVDEWQAREAVRSAGWEWESSVVTMAKLQHPGRSEGNNWNPAAAAAIGGAAFT
jgi:hypothetical protein